jgi:hypothetical protein
MSYDNTLSRLPDPSTDPQGPGFLSAYLMDNSPGTIHRLNTGATLGVKYAGNYWTINISWPELFPEEAENLFPFLYSVSGGFEQFYVQLPQHAYPKTGAWDTSTNNFVAKGNISIGPTADTIIIPQWSTRGGDLSPLDTIKFDNSNKVYMVRSRKVESDVATIRLNCDILEPQLIPSAGLQPNDILFKVRMTGTIAPVLTARGLYESIQVTLEENIL